MSQKIPTSIRLSAEAKARAEKLAKLENRSVSNWIETLINEAFQKHEIKTKGNNAI